MEGNFYINCKSFFEVHSEDFSKFIKLCIIDRIEKNYDNKIPPYFPARQMATIIHDLVKMQYQKIVKNY